MSALEEGGLQSRCFIFPNRRSLVFFRKHLADAVKERSGAGGHPVIAPEMLTVSDFFSRASGVRVTDRITLMLELYECYKALNPAAEALDEFIFWGDVILGDFNDVDKYLADPKQLFTNVADLKALQDSFSYLTERQRKAVESFVSHFNDRSGRLTVDLSPDSPDMKGRFLRIWNLMYPLYVSFREHLSEKGLAYEGMVYRDLAERLKQESGDLGALLGREFRGVEKFVFTGLNALNECEKTVMRRMRDEGIAEFCWDYSGDMIRDRRNRSSFFMEQNVEDFPQKREWDPEGVKPPRIRVVSVPSSVGQVKMIPDILRKADDCAVVLPDESLLMPLLNIIPPEIKDVNVTMGYPMAWSSFHCFMSTVSAMQLHVRKRPDGCYFYHKQVWDLFSDSIFRKVMTDEDAAKVGEVKAAAKLYIPAGDLGGTPLFDMVFAPVLTDGEEGTPELIDAFASYQLRLIEGIVPLLGQDENVAVEAEFAKEYWLSVSGLRRQRLEVRPVTYMRILEQLLAGVSVPFNGEPLKGLQIMGPLEMRALDFRNLVILSANEGVFPRRSVSSSFIPPELRRGFGLPAYEFQDAVWAYYFYRMIARAENVWLFYDSRTEGMKTGEESRYIRQLEYHFMLPIERLAVVSPARAGMIGDEIPKTAEAVEAIRRRPLSASSLQTYLACQAKFYYQVVEHLYPEDEVTESLDSAMVGTVFHEVMQKIFSECGRDSGGQVTAEQISGWSSSADRIRGLVRDGMSEQLHTVEITGRNLVMQDVIVRYVQQTLSRDFELLKEEKCGGFRIEGLELELFCDFGGFRFKGIIDRLDSLSDGEIRIVDYKTGKVLPADMNIGEDSKWNETVNTLFSQNTKYDKKPKIALQLFIYDMLAEANGLACGRRLINSVYSTAGLFSEAPRNVAVAGGFMNEMKERLSSLLTEMADVEKPFVRTSDRRVCGYCDFRKICGR